MPELKEDDIFRTFIPIGTKKNNQDIEDIGEEIEKENKINVGVNNTQKKILKLIEENKNITQKEIASKLKTTLRTVERNINALKDKDILKRIGVDKRGYWEIIKRDIEN